MAVAMARRMGTIIRRRKECFSTEGRQRQRKGVVSMVVKGGILCMCRENYSIKNDLFARSTLIGMVNL